MMDVEKEKQQGKAESSKKKERRMVTWTQEEDEILREQIGINGTENWAIIASKFKDKTTRQCRRRWYTYLNSNFKKGGWTPEEDMLLCEAQKVFGNRWTEIAKVVSGRTDNAVKNRFSTLRKKREKSAALEKENIIPYIDSNSKRNISHQGYNTHAMSESSMPVKKMRRAHISDGANKIIFGDRSHLRNAVSTNQQPRAPFSELAKKSNCVNNLPVRHHSFNDKFNSSGQNNKSQLKKDYPKISALIQIIDSENMENLWKPLLEFLNRTDIIGEKIEVLQLVSRMVKELKSSNERGHSCLRQMEPDEDSPGSSEYSSGSTLLPKSTGTADNLESSLNLDIGTEMKATHLEGSLNQDIGTEMKATHLESSLNQDSGTEMKAAHLENSLNQDIGTEMKAGHLESSLNQDSGTEMKAAHLENSLNQDIGTEMKATQFEVKKEECEGVEGVLSTGKVEQDMMPHGEEQINASSRMECSPIQVTPIFRSLAEGIPSPEFSESEKNFLRKTLGVESPSINTSFSPFKLPPCIRSLQY
ncbi:transcription factor MYB88 [Trifolium repens]|nr:transcription factor MYB88 [Trifolium repens]